MALDFFLASSGKGMFAAVPIRKLQKDLKCLPKGRVWFAGLQSYRTLKSL